MMMKNLRQPREFHFLLFAFYFCLSATDIYYLAIMIIIMVVVYWIIFFLYWKKSEINFNLVTQRYSDAFSVCLFEIRIAKMKKKFLKLDNFSFDYFSSFFTKRNWIWKLQIFFSFFWSTIFNFDTKWYIKRWRERPDGVK